MNISESKLRSTGLSSTTRMSFISFGSVALLFLLYRTDLTPLGSPEELPTALPSLPCFVVTVRV
jgi:hypothetical protein